ncbi:hypothetical protein [Micrococcoides hystricis]|uniref:DUF4190 domain-containing protein n=1 Tax=Micrococcoides hystricis TaxID=1572761 RepID=A0ABV6PBZ9_9MICC
MTTSPPPYQPGGFQPGLYPPNHHPMGRQQQVKKINGVGLVALILGVVVILLAVVSIAPLLAVIVAGVAIIVGIVAVALRNRAKGTAIAGPIWAGIGLVLMPILHPPSLFRHLRWEAAAPFLRDRLQGVLRENGPSVLPTGS